MGWLDSIVGKDDDSGGNWLNTIANLAGGYMTSQAANKAAKQQTSALNKGNDLLWQMYQTTRADNAPARQLGNAAISRLMGGFGFSGGGQGFNPQAARQDTIPAKINPQEAQVLKNLGGAGVRDPRTGFWHFYNDPMGDSSDPGSSNYGGGIGDRDSGSEGGGIRASALRDFKGINTNAIGKISSEGLQRGIEGLSHTAGDTFRDDATRSAFNTMAQSATTPGLNAREAQIASFGTNPTDEYNVATKEVRDIDWGSVLGNIFSGNVYGLYKDYKNAPVHTEWDTWGNGEPIQAREAGNGNERRTLTGGSMGYSYPTPANGQPLTSDSAADMVGGFSNTNNVLGDFEQDFNPWDIYNDPSYQWRVSENLRNLDKSAASKGTMFSGQYIKDLSDYIQGQASQEYGDAWNRYQTNRGNKFNMLASMAGMGQTATGNVNSAGLNTANLMGNNYAGIGNANAAGTVGSSNAWTNALNQTMNGWNLYNLLNG